MTQQHHLDRALLGLLYISTAVIGQIDAVSFLGLGHIFTANMTGNIVFLGFATAGAQSLSVPRSLSALGAFLVGALIGGRIAASAWFQASADWPMSRSELKPCWCSRQWPWELGMPRREKPLFQI
jgi:uncharacterized membrane protein YoaK (UPF0700 family)